MKKLLFFILYLVAFSFATTNAQQALFGGGAIASPEVHENKTVTFRIKAPDSKEVKLSGDWMPSENYRPGSVNLVKSDDGTWSYTSDALSSNLYTYYFTIDGVRVIDPSNIHVVRDVSSLFSMVLVPGGQGDYYKVNNVPHGTVARRWYNSPGNNMVRRVTIYTPPGYETGKEKYPVFYLLHGMGGDEEAWIALGRTAQIMDNLIAEGKAKPMIVVMTNGNVIQEAAPGESSLGFYQPTMRVERSMEGSMEKTFPDVIKFVESNYRVIAEKKGRAIAGLSMGGFHSLHISRIHPNTFDYVGLFSAAVMPSNDVNSEVYKNIDETLKVQKDYGLKLYWIGIGKDDFLYQANVDYRAKLDKIGMPYEYYESADGHVWKNWRLYLTLFTPKLF